MNRVMYQKPVAEAVQFDNEDVITTSPFSSWEEVASWNWDGKCQVLQGIIGDVFRISLKDSDGKNNSNGASQEKWNDGQYRYGWTCDMWGNQVKG